MRPLVLGYARLTSPSEKYLCYFEFGTSISVVLNGDFCCSRAGKL
jgi:hypothetical protein